MHIVSVYVYHFCAIKTELIRCHSGFLTSEDTTIISISLTNLWFNELVKIELTPYIAIREENFPVVNFIMNDVVICTDVYNSSKILFWKTVNVELGQSLPFKPEKKNSSLKLCSYQ